MFFKNKIWTALLAADILLAVFLVLASNLQILPLGMGDFIFLSILALALALYRPGWVFLFFVGTIMFENVNLAPAELGIAIRPYQFFGGLAIVAIIIRVLTGRSNLKLIRLNLYDWAAILLGAASFASALFAEDTGAALKQSVILASFIFLYFLVRNYVRSSEDLRKILPFFISPSIMVFLYGIWQNVRFGHNMAHFQVMPGRPNGTFTEPDWFGMFIVFTIAAIYGLMFFFNNKKKSDDKTYGLIFFRIAPYVMLAVSYVVLILTVSRSAWVGVLAVNFIFLTIILTDLKFDPKLWQWKTAVKVKIPIYLTVALGVALVYAFNLTDFELGNRLQSAGSGKQEITVSCDAGSDVPRSIVDISELDKFNCRHIDLEDIENEEMSGRIVTRAYRNDPNVDIRSEIYKKSWEEIRRSPISGVGWGNISNVLGKDERGAGLNSSNIFLETWLGAGILGIIAFIAIWWGVIVRALRLFLHDGLQQKSLGIFLILGTVAILVPNLFNAGIMLGYLWLFLGLTSIKK